MKTEYEAIPGALAHERQTAWAWRRFALLLAAVLAFASTRLPPIHNGDAFEYGLTTIALAHHATPDIRFEDLDAARPLMPGFVPDIERMVPNMRAGAYSAIPGIVHYRGGYYTIHFFGYPALAAIPFKVLAAAGADPMRCFLVVNALSVFVLGLALFRLFGSTWRAGTGLLAWALCGGVLYFQWSSPECMSSCALLAGLALFITGAPVPGGLLAGLGAMQNPPIVFFCAFAPLLRLALGWRRERSLAANLRATFGWREFAGVCACAAVFAVPVLFNLYIFSTPSVIGSLTTEARFVTPGRLHAFFFDLNQGMVMGVPFVAAALLLWRGARWPLLAVLTFAVTMAVPSLSTQNFNSGAAGIMRYAMWASMPLLFLFLWRLRAAPRWPVAIVVLVLAGQAWAMENALTYSHVEFSPLARRVMAAAPGWYNPEPEIFYERAVHQEIYPDPNRIFTWSVDGRVVKTMYNVDNPSAATQLCGLGRVLASDNRFATADRGWRYINGPVRCTAAAR